MAVINKWLQLTKMIAVFTFNYDMIIIIMASAMLLKLNESALHIINNRHVKCDILRILLVGLEHIP